ncbi:MAG: M28 family peptidase [Chloroflexi bacterium]|nr:M28 family peptidase [Chloroflexota bacterium]
MLVSKMNHDNLMGYARLLEIKQGIERRDALKVLLQCQKCAYTAESFSIFGQKGVNYLVVFGEGQREILAAAHYDAVPGSPGANDNASSVTVLLDLWRRLKRHQLKNKVKIIFFDGEEASFRIGCLGSWAYVRKHGVSNIIGMYNLELCGQGDTIAIWPVKFHHNSTLNILEDVLKEKSIPYGRVNIFRYLFSSDHLHFRRRGLEEAFGISAVPSQDAEALRRFAEGRWPLAKLVFSRLLGRSKAKP